MLHIDFETLRLFLDENLDFFINARLQKIQQPTRRDFLFSLRNNGESKKLYININPQIYHIAFINERTQKRRNIKFPKTPPMFCMLLRKYLEGCKITDALVVENERILEFHFEIMDEVVGLREVCLAIELMGKHSNIILYDRISKIIIGCAHNVGPEKSRYRELQGGLKYIYPPKVNELNKLATPFYKNFEISSNTINNLIDEYYSKYQEELVLNNEKNSLIGTLQPKIKRLNNSISKINALLKKRDNTEKYKLYGELLTANSYQKVLYQNEIEVFDYINNKNITIEIDNTKTIAENAQKYYKLYSKSKITKEKSLEMLEKLNVEKEYLENILYSINISDNLEDIEEIKSELNIEEIKPKKTEKSELMKFKIKDFDVYVGKNNKQNDYLVSKLARDEDFWFHTRLCAGSHVLLITNGIEPDEEVLFECCKLARKYSSASQPSKVGVIYTKAKYLKKPPAAPLGYVIYKNEKEILI